MLLPRGGGGMLPLAVLAVAASFLLRGAQGGVIWLRDVSGQGNQSLSLGRTTDYTFRCAFPRFSLLRDAR
jgi:hypothetical protein